MRENWKRVSDLAVASEGGFTDDSRDPGNWTGGKVGKGKLLGTKYGIAANTYPNVDIPNLTRAQAVAIYKRDYWDKVSGDRLPSGVDYTIFDYALNSGVRRASLDLQRACGVTPVDGVIGTSTLRQVDELNARDVIEDVNARRLAFMKSLKIWPTYGKGWTTRVNKVRSVSLQLAKGAAPSVKAMPLLESAKAPSSQITNTAALTNDGESQVQTSAGVGVGGSALVEVSQSITETSQQLEPLTYYLEIAKYLFLLLAVAGFGISVYLMIKRKRQQV